jgi:hypothetical protein
MVATGAELPAFEFTVQGQRKRILLEVVRSGTLTKVSKTDRMYISGSGGGGYVYGNYTPGYGGYVSGHSSPISITTTYKTTMELWILGSDGRESSFRLDEDIPLKEGHTVTIVGAYLEGTQYSRPCLVVNQTARELYFLEGSQWLFVGNFLPFYTAATRSALRMVIAAGLVAIPLLAASLTLGLFCPLSCVFLLPAGGFFVYWLTRFVPQLMKATSEFRQHCYRVGEQLLRGSF